MKTIVKDIMHVRTIFSPSTEASDIEFAEFLLLGQLNVMTEVAMFPLLNHKVKIKHNINIYNRIACIGYKTYL